MASQYERYYRYPYFRPNHEELYDICTSVSDNGISDLAKWNKYHPINQLIGNPDYKQWTPQGRLGTFFSTVKRNKMPTDMIYKIHEQGFYYENNLNIIKCHKCESTYCSDTIENITPCHWPHCDYELKLDDKAGGDIAKEIREEKATLKKIDDVKDNMCIRCGSKPSDVVFMNCNHCVTCCLCSECIDYCPKCDSLIVCREYLYSGNSVLQCDRCTTFSAQVVTHDCKNEVLCQNCSKCIDFCPRCNKPIGHNFT
ncbi:Hypothetical predicted protein [Mytilus galloprovincialis]|uniref:RING-type domain-containing protein n=1 Tax=Mytilus galloprovincialis TaxID=29158 RepID=A0A8B6C8B2_MYTGA|nr:Hypothetical predicted protein [Mytilus galloprovincialis]